jgi:hypothetical protein
MNSPSSETLSTEDAVQTIGGRNTRGDKSDSPGRRNEKSYARTVFNFQYYSTSVSSRISRCETENMAKQETVSLRKHLDNLLRMKGAHLSFEAAVAGFPAALSGVKPAGAPHSAWELLEHMRIAQEDILDFSRNPAYREKKFPDDYWPATEAPPSEEAWSGSVARFQADLREMQALIADTGHDLLAKIPHGGGQTLLREALLVADHNAYHLGQLMFLRKMLEAPPAPRK